MSLDQVLQLQNDSILFQAPDISQKDIPFADYLRGLLSQLKYFNSFKERQMFYLCKDMIYFHFYLYPEFAAFKTFFWLKTILNKQEYNHKKFSLAEFSFPECFAVGQDMIKEYNKIPSVELWNFEIMPRETFFAMGGNSLLATQVIFRLAALTGLAPDVLYELIYTME